MRQTPGTTTPAGLRIEVLQADGGCVGPRVGMPGECRGAIWPDHIRASHGMGMKSPTVRSNLASLCFSHHALKTNEGRKWRPVLLEHVARRDGAGAER